MSAAPNFIPPETEQSVSAASPSVSAQRQPSKAEDQWMGMFSLSAEEIRKKVWLAMLPLFGIGLILWIAVSYRPALMGGFLLFLMELGCGVAAVYLVWPREPKKRAGH